MTEPVFSESTERLWERLPGVYKREDVDQDYEFKKFIAGTADVLGQIDTIVDRMAYESPEDNPVVPDTYSALVNPVTADADWLPWLAQLVGVKFDYLLTEQQKRDRIANAIGGVRAGTKAAITQAVQSVLTGTKTVYVYPFSKPGVGIGTGSQWEVLIRTIQSETVSDPVAAVVAAGAKPAGVKLYHEYYGTSWTTFEAQNPTFSVLDTKTWAQIEQG